MLLHSNGDTVTLDGCQVVGAQNGQTGYTGAVELFGVGSSVITGCNVTETFGECPGRLCWGFRAQSIPSFLVGGQCKSPRP